MHHLLSAGLWEVEWISNSTLPACFECTQGGPSAVGGNKILKCEGATVAKSNCDGIAPRNMLCNASCQTHALVLVQAWTKKAQCWTRVTISVESTADQLWSSDSCGAATVKTLPTVTMPNKFWSGHRKSRKYRRITLDSYVTNVQILSGLCHDGYISYGSCEIRERNKMCTKTPPREFAYFQIISAFVGNLDGIRIAQFQIYGTGVTEKELSVTQVQYRLSFNIYESVS
ncbi:hypothetical protein F2P81_021913 [Scophthalmus maximus]|uniref:Uncharacterized protein n=1 Tax=Scophthalmus maximus TaxID=52904 RepID=A0A6A4S0R8_SCOMX|nr:hypothetical protein F2P81_021913 [Scophthalmus maximus]